VIETQIWAPGWYLSVGPAELGLSLAPFMLDRAPIICNDSSPTDTDDSEARAEKERADRRKVLALNKFGHAAQGVRRQFDPCRSLHFIMYLDD